MKFDPRDENSIKSAIAKSNVVINLIGVAWIIFNELGGSSSSNLIFIILITCLASCRKGV